MTTETNFTGSPYFQSNTESNYYQVLFQPSVPVQVRELNQLQSMLQKQIEEFGDNILKKGTIVRGCSFGFYNNYKYVKIKDSNINLLDTVPSAYVNKLIKNSSNVVGYVVNYVDGFESTDPNLKTLYIKYTNSGNDGQTTSFSPGDLLTVFDQNNTIQDVGITAAGVGYSNNDSVIFCSALAVVNTSANVFSAGHIITQTTSNAQAVITEVNNSIFSDRTVLKLRPVDADLANTSGNTAAWTFSASEDSYIITDATTGATAKVKESIGAGAAAGIITLGNGQLEDILMTSGGTGYYVAPYAAVKPTTGGSSAQLNAKNYTDQIYVATTANAVGTGYAFSVSNGVIYQKGYFLNVDEQVVIVTNYSPYPNNISVGFATQESIITSSEDTNLLDNALGSPNYTAPGADRLQLIPKLSVRNVDTMSNDPNYLSLVEWSQGVPYKQNQTTQYNIIGDHIAEGISDVAGDFITDKFNVATISNANSSLDANKFTTVIDPGTAYINGFKVQTTGNFYIDVDKGIDTSNNHPIISMNFGSYVYVNNIAGFFPFGQGLLMNLYNAAGGYLANTAAIAAGTISTSGTLIGTARVRSLVAGDGNNGAANATYKMYLYDIQMISGANFSSVKSIYYNGTNTGIADIVLENGIAVVKEVKNTSGQSLDKMLFNSGIDSPLSFANVQYTYRTFKQTGVELANTGLISYTLSGLNDFFPYTGTLSQSQVEDILLFPSNNVTANTNTAGTWSVNTTTVAAVGTSTTMLTDWRTGDYVYLAGNSTQSDVKRVVSVNSDTGITLDSNVAFTNAAAAAWRYFPKNVALPLDNRAGLTANVDIATQKTLTVSLGMRTNAAANVVIGAAFNVLSNNVTSSTKTPTRSVFVKIKPSNNSTGAFVGIGTANGTITLVNANGTITGSATAFTTDFANGDVIELKNVSNGLITIQNYTINAVTNSTSIILTSNVNFASTNATIRKAGNFQGPWCLGMPDIFRLRNVYLANTATVNANSYSVTSNFNIDHRQNQNYLDLGSLVLSKNSTLTLGANDYLLVELDVFTSSGTFNHINSYVSGNSAIRFATDSLPLANLTSSPLSVNTLEIPELVGDQGDYYDLITSIDFRPIAANTANLATIISNATLNPANTRTFNAIDYKFPVPNSTAALDSTSFIGRVDSVVADDQGKFSVIRGQPISGITPTVSNINRQSQPQQPINTILLNSIIIPAYPSLTEGLSKTSTDILAKHVISNRILSQRISASIITKMLSQTQIDINQPIAFSMADIGNLKRRIEDLEYYVGMSLMELQIKDKLIPSSVSSSINRFKFGFFVDTYDNSTYSLINDREFRASFANTRVVPSFEQVALSYGNTAACVCTDFLIASQPIATGNSGGPSTPPICVATTVAERQQFSSLEFGAGTAQTRYTDALNISMASQIGNNSGNVVVYMYMYPRPDRLEIYQSTSNNFSNTPSFTSDTSVPLTNNDIAYLLSNTKWFSQISNNDLLKHVTGSGIDTGYFAFGGKLTFQHSPSSGRNYMIKTHKGSGSDVWRYRIEYPVNVDCVIPPAGNPPPTPQQYNGVLTIVSDKPVYTTTSSPGPQGSTFIKTNTDHAIVLKATGLMPLTNHQFFSNKINATSNCDQTLSGPVPASNTNFSTYIKTDASGQATFELYVSDPVFFNLFVRSTKINPTDRDSAISLLEIYNSDKSSYATCNYVYEIPYSSLNLASHEKAWSKL